VLTLFACLCGGGALKIQLADLKRKQSKAKRGAKQASRSKQSDVEMKENEDSDDDEDWFEEEDIDDREEVIRRTLYYKTYMVFFYFPCQMPNSRSGISLAFSLECLSKLV